VWSDYSAFDVGFVWLRIVVPTLSQNTRQDGAPFFVRLPNNRRSFDYALRTSLGMTTLSQRPRRLSVAEFLGHDDEVGGLGEMLAGFHRNFLNSGDLVAKFLIDHWELFAQVDDAQIHKAAA